MKALYICSERTNWNNFISFFRDQLRDVELFCARNGNDSMDIIVHESPISIVIIDSQLQDEEQLTIAEDIIEASGQRPIIFLGDENDVNEIITSEFFNLYKTNEIIEKPANDERLKEVILKGLEWSSTTGSNEAHKEVMDEQYVPIKLKSFFLYDKVAYDVFYLVYANNYMKVITKNKRYPESTIQNLARKNVKDLYLIRTEKIKFLEESMAKAIEILASKNTSIEKIFTTQICSVILIHQMLNEVGVSEAVVELSELIISVVPVVSKRFRDFSSLQKSMPITYGDIGEQAIFMLYLCYALTRSLEWESELTMKKLGLACILHDCKLQIDDLSLVKNEQDNKLSEFNLADLNNFKEHALTASQISTEFTNFPDCSFIIREHHALPEKRYTQKMNSISCLFTLARRLTTELANVGFTGAGLQLALPELKVYEFGNFKKVYDQLILLFSKV